MYKVLVKEKQLTSGVNRHTTVQRSLPASLPSESGQMREKRLKRLKMLFLKLLRVLRRMVSPKEMWKGSKLQVRNHSMRELTEFLNKSFQLAFFNTLVNDPGYMEKDIESIKAVTIDDILKVYEKYIKGKPHIVTSFVPKGKLELMAENSVSAAVKEEKINEASQVEISGTADEMIVKTPSAIDRTVEPPFAEEPEIKIPEIWKATLKNGIRVYGIYNSELPLVNINLSIDGGVCQDSISLPGLAGMVAAVLPQGTKNRTPEELEEADRASRLGYQHECGQGRVVSICQHAFQKL